jgi:ubiquinone biosynthesis protein
VESQPQLVLLQKTLLNVEGLGRELNPQLDLWDTAKPYLEKWMHERVGLKALQNKIKSEAVQWAQWLPEFPRLMHESLSRPDLTPVVWQELRSLRKERQQSNRLMTVLIVVIALSLAVGLYRFW